MIHVFYASSSSLVHSYDLKHLESLVQDKNIEPQLDAFLVSRKGWL